MSVFQEVAAIGDQNINELLDEVASALNRQHRAGWDIAQRVYRLHVDYGMTDQAISEKLRERGVDVARPTINMYRNAYGYYVDRMGLSPAELNIPITTLAQARPFLEDAKVGKDVVSDILKAISGLQQREALQYIRNYFGIGTDKIAEFGTIKVTREVFDMFASAHKRMNEAVEAGGYPKLSKTAFLELLSQLVLESDHADLLALYRRELGEQLTDKEVWG